jgi:uncharacterized membrane protein
MKTRVALGALALSALSLPAMAGGGGPFEAEIDCGGLVSPPAQVPYQLRFENQTQQNQALDVTVRLSIPTGASITLREANINLAPNQDRAIRQTLNLPANAPSGSYQMTIVASTPTFSTFDTCSFNAN